MKNNIETNILLNSIEDLSEQEYPNIPVYLTVDHFWHWIVKVCDKNRLKPFNNRKYDKKKHIIAFFNEYCKWDKSTDAYTVDMGKKSDRIQYLLSKDKIKKLNQQKVLEIYRSFHATQSLIQRFHLDNKFIAQNTLVEIMKSFNYLIYDTEEMHIKIDNMTKANDAIKLLGFL